MSDHNEKDYEELFLLLYLFGFFRILSEECDSIIPLFIKGSIEQSLKKTFGEIGGHIDKLDLIKFHKESSTLIQFKFILRTIESDYVKIRTALTLISQYQGVSCYFKVNGVSSSLPSLIGIHLKF